MKADAAAPGVAIVCGGEDELEALRQVLASARKCHFGLFKGCTGKLADGREAWVAVAEQIEASAYAAVAQLDYLFHPELVASFGVGFGLRENMRSGDLVAARAVRRVWCPPAVADNSFTNDDLVFPDEELRRQVLQSPVLDFGAGVAADAKRLILGSMDRIPRPHRRAEFLRTRFGVDMCDAQGYGFAEAAQQVKRPAVCFRVIGESCNMFDSQEFERNRQRNLNRAAAECLRQIQQSSVSSYV